MFSCIVFYISVQLIATSKVVKSKCAIEKGNVCSFKNVCALSLGPTPYKICPALKAFAGEQYTCTHAAKQEIQKHK